MMKTCRKKGNSYDVVMADTEKTHFETVQEVAGENDGGCKCGTACSCGSSCTCGH